VLLGDVAKIVSGITLGRPVRAKPTRPVPYLRVANAKDGWLDLSDVYQIEATEDEIQKCRLHYGDILLTEGGDPDKLGRGTFWEEQIPECVHQNHIFRVRLPREEFCYDFVSLQIGSPYGKAYFFAHPKQTTGIATINRTVLNRFPLLFPSLPEQRRIAARLREQPATVAEWPPFLRWRAQLCRTSTPPAVISSKWPSSAAVVVGAALQLMPLTPRAARLNWRPVIIDTHYGRVKDTHMGICHLVCYVFTENLQ
jgi:hypothetical protein